MILYSARRVCPKQSKQYSVISLQSIQMEQLISNNYVCVWIFIGGWNSHLSDCFWAFCPKILARWRGDLQMVFWQSLRAV